MSQSTRPTYNEDQLRQYLDHVGKQDRIAKEQCNAEEGLKYLNELIPLQLAKVTFENLDLHYSTHHSVSLDSDFLFHKIVERKAGRGGYCMQNNAFFATILTTLGYKVMPCGARVSSASGGVSDPAQARYSGWSHSVNVVYINDHKYLVDVGFGANCPSMAIPMIDGWTGRKPWNDEEDDQLLKRMHISDNTCANEEQKLWVYHVSFGQDKPWMPMYCFSEVEFLPQDFAIMNYQVSHSLSSWFTYQVVCTKLVLDDQGIEMGVLTLFGDQVKQRIRGQSEVLTQCNSEDERVKMMEKYFGIKLQTSEINGIKGWVSMLK